MASAFDQQILAKLPSTRRYARALLGDHELANEAVLFAITRLSRTSLPRVPEKMIRLWLVHLVNEFADRRHAQTAPSGDAAAEHVEDSVFDLPTKTQVGGSDLLMARIDPMLQDLSENQRRIYLLLALESFSVENVAQLLGMSVERISAEFDLIKTQLAPPPVVTPKTLPKAA